MSIFQVDYLSAIEVSGEEAGSFLQSQLSADVDALDPGDCTFACYCTPRGQVIALLLVCRVEDRFRLICSDDLAEAVLQRLRLYVMRAKAAFERLQHAVVIGHDPATSGAPEKVYQPPDLPIGYSVSEKAGSAGQPGSADWKLRELKAGVFWLQKDNTEQYIPQMLGYDDLGAVSFSKGCYPGQEIVARTRYLGKVKRGVLKLKIDKASSLDIMAKVRIERDGEWSQARVMDRTNDPAGGIVAVVHCTREPETEVTAIELDGQVYRCATI